MNKSNGDGRAAAALHGFRLFHGACVRAIDAGEMDVRPAGPGSRGFQIDAGGRNYVLTEKRVGSIDARLKEEPSESAKAAALVADRNELLDIAKRLQAMNERLAAENEALRAVLTPYEESVTTVNRDPETLELISSRTFKKTR